MGVDGTDGCSHFKTVGARILVQDEATCAVYGMPASVVKAGYADAILPLHKIAEGIVEACAN
jgi:two-component system chemotaxis response regulator CheB